MEDLTNKLVDFPVFVRKYKTTLTTKFINRKKWVQPNPNEIESHIPGTIIDIKVKEGETVEEGKALVILESMKMLNEITMPLTGDIVKINVEKNQIIPKGFVLMEVEYKI